MGFSIEHILSASSHYRSYIRRHIVPRHHPTGPLAEIPVMNSAGLPGIESMSLRFKTITEAVLIKKIYKKTT
jgi:hypothetical protein